jgi:putative acetyltransferase
MTTGMRKRHLTIVQSETPDKPEVLAFLAAADERSASLYPTESRYGPSLRSLLAADVRFFVARQDGRAVGCGGFVLLRDYSAEMKRLFVDPASRGPGVDRALVQAIEEAASCENVKTLFLETGIKSAEALRLYTRLGFETCSPFAEYKPDPLSVFMTKQLPPSRSEAPA